jgi:hypothetical protein
VWFEDDWPQVAKDISRAVAADEAGQVYLGLVGGSGCEPPTDLQLWRDGADWFLRPVGGHVEDVVCEAPVKGVAIYRVPKSMLPANLRLNGEVPAEKVPSTPR